jgi:hypothetical protein
MAIVVDGKNVYQLTDMADGTPQIKTPEQRALDHWPPPDGTKFLKSPDLRRDIGK